MSELLQGCRILVTRPAGQAENLARAIRQAGGEPFLLPVLAIEPLPESRALKQQAAAVASYDALIFISANAVRHGMPLLAPALEGGRIPPCFAVGRQTARALASWGITAEHPVRGHDSEALLALPALQQVAGQKIMIVRGVGGRETLKQVLEERQAEVHYLECYRRSRPVHSVETLMNLSRNPVQIMMATSGTAVESLAALLQKAGVDAWQSCPLIVGSERCRDIARKLGWLHVRVAPDATDEQMLKAAIQWWQSRQQDQETGQP